MSTSADIALVAQAVLQRHTYYLANRAGITLDGTDYDNTMLSVSDGAQEGNFGEGFRIGSIKVVLANGETFINNDYKYQVTDIWSNKVLTIKRYEDGDTTWAGCDDYYKGLVKDFLYQFGKISFSVDAKDYRDDILLPSIKCEDNSGLSDAEAQSVFHNTGVENQIQVSNTNIFGVGELVKLTTPNGNTEYQKILRFTGSIMHFYEDCLYYSDQAADFTNKIEKSFRNLPKAFIGKTLPIQIGDLSDSANGEFGKTITISELIGKQSIIADNFTLNDLDNIGAWESGLGRYFVGKSTGEYTIDSNYKAIIFRVDSTTTLSADILSTSDGILNIFVNDYTKLNWINEDDDDVDTLPELLTTNIIGVNRELMALVEEPYTSQIYVERGYNNTEISTHDTDDIIYQSANYSSRNLLSFTERFEAKAVANQAYGDTPPYIIGNIEPNDVINSGIWSYITQSDDSTYLEFTMENPTTGVVLYVSADLKFDHIEDDFTVAALYMALHTKHSGNAVGETMPMTFVIYNPTGGADYSTPPSAANAAKFTYVWQDIITGVRGETDIDTFSSIVRDSYSAEGGELVVKPDFNETRDVGGSGFNGTAFLSTSLKDLNKKWKMGIGSTPPFADQTGTIKIYRVGLWVDFFLNFTEQTIMAPLKGREVTTDVTTVNGEASPSRVGDLCKNPVDFTALMLLQELGYETTDFDANWGTVWGEIDTLAAVCATSYGVDDKQEKGWEFCEWIASHFNLAITKLSDGTIDIVNLWEIYADTPAGTEIDIEDDVLFLEESSEKLMVIKQTGTDLIYNDIIVKYARNNSTGEYQKEYHLPDTYILENDMVPPINLLDARNRYYNGKKRTKVIESPFIYTEAEAQRKAEWEANNHACVNLWIEVGLDYNNTDRIGDVKYFTGNYNGVVLSSDNKFFIQNKYPADEGRELAIHCKSIQGVDAIVNPDDDNVILDTGGTTLTGDDIWNDTGGTGVTGDDVINDTGGGSTI